MLSSVNDILSRVLESSNFTSSTLLTTWNSKGCISFIRYLIFVRINPKLREHTTISKPAVYPLGITYIFEYDFLNSFRSVIIRTEIEVRRSLRTRKVFVTSEFTYTFPKSIETGPANIFCNYKPVNGVLVSRISEWFVGSLENFFFTAISGSGSNFFASSYLYGSYESIGIVTKSDSFALYKFIFVRPIHVNYHYILSKYKGDIYLFFLTQF